MEINVKILIRIHEHNPKNKNKDQNKQTHVDLQHYSITAFSIVFLSSSTDLQTFTCVCEKTECWEPQCNKNSQNCR